jgi:hypothetical protein
MQFMQRTLRYADDAYCALYHLAYYFSRGPADDQDRKRLLAFKNGDEHAQRYFILNTLDALKKQEPAEDLVVLRALSSTEISADDSSSPLDRLGDSIAMVYGCSYYPKIVTKNRLTRPLKTLNLSERKEELVGVYQVDPHFFNFNYHPVMVIDDVVTTGATTGSIIGSIIRSFPRARISVLSLAWTPSPAQQEFLQRGQLNSDKISEEEYPYGWKISDWEDSDFLDAKTDVSVFSI